MSEPITNTTRVIDGKVYRAAPETRDPQKSRCTGCAFFLESAPLGSLSKCELNRRGIKPLCGGVWGEKIWVLDPDAHPADEPTPEPKPEPVPVASTTTLREKLDIPGVIVRSNGHDLKVATFQVFDLDVVSLSFPKATGGTAFAGQEMVVRLDEPLHDAGDGVFTCRKFNRSGWVQPDLARLSFFKVVPA